MLLWTLQQSLFLSATLYHSIALRRAGIPIPFSFCTFYYPDTIWSVFNTFFVSVKKHYYRAVRNLENLHSLWSVHSTAILGTWTKQNLARHFKKEVHFGLGSTGRPLSILCHLLANPSNYRFPRRGTVSALSSGARSDGKIPRAEVGRGVLRVVLPHRAEQSSHQTDLTHSGVCTVLGSALAGFTCSYETLQKSHFSEACADFGWFIAGPWSRPCGVLCPSAARGQGSLSWAAQAVEGCLPSSHFSGFPFEVMHRSQPGFITSWRRPPLFKICAV